MSKKLLDVRSVTMRFGGLKAVDELTFHIHPGELIGLIGPNGAGKTTVFNLLTGVYQPSEGEIYFDGQLINTLKPYQISRLGMTRTFQNIRLFKNLSVLENVLIASHDDIHYYPWNAVIQDSLWKSGEKKLQQKAMELLSLFHLDSKSSIEAGGLPYGEQRKLEIIRALATQPKIICLDEPAAGLNHQETHLLMETIAKIRKEFGLTVLLIEHDMKLVMGICERIVVLDHGVKIEEGSPNDIRNSSKVIEAYLGPEVLS